MNTPQSSNATDETWEVGPERLNRGWLLLPVLAVMLVFVGVNVLRDRTQLTCEQVTFYAEMKPCPRAAHESPLQPEEQAKFPPVRRVVTLEPGSSLKILSTDLSGRLQLSAAAIVFFVAFATLVSLCGVWIYRCRSRPLTKADWCVYSIAAFLIVAAVVFVWVQWRHDPRVVTLLLRSFDQLDDELFRKTTVGLSGLDQLTGALAVISAVLLAVTVSLILNGMSSDSARLAELRMRCAALRTSLAAGAAVLAAAVLVVRALHGWILGFIAELDREPLRAIADSWAMAIGTYWTLVLVAAYVPAAMLAHHAAIEMADQHNEKEPQDKRTRDQWMEEEGLNVTLKGQVARALMLLAPWLSGGPLAEIGKQFFG
jgi:hypothetical protein